MSDEVLHDLLDSVTRRFPETPAVASPTGERTYRELADESLRLAAGLAGAGVRRGERVLLCLSRPEDVPALVWACSRVAAVFVLTRAELPETVLRHMIADAGPVLVVTDDSGVSTVARDMGVPVRTPHELPCGPVPLARPLPVDAACFIYTSGSTALPKAVVSTHRQVCFAARAVQSRLSYRDSDTVYCALPLSFDYGLYQLFLCALAGARLWLAEGAGPALVNELTAAGATVLPGVPSLTANLARLVARRPAPPSLRLLTNTGAAMPPALLARLRAASPGLRVQLMYGLTECKRATILAPDEDLDRPGSCGRALPGTEVFAIGADGTRVPPGEVGELVVRGPNVMAGYWRRPELTGRVFPRAEGLFPELRTGDQGRVDDEGYVYFAGRRDDLYKERGTRVSAIEVEAAACRVPGVRAAAVRLPGADEFGAMLFVESELDGHAVLAALGEHLEAAKVPARCVVVDRLPLTPNGKIDRRALDTVAAR
ncbi:class I adenylate-forming enzyme family protein [Amycolatopsis alba]|uniref:AMP-dependent synthetase n=1 Tax=Amycolatopsis alba DSM 44262 TaxID=1125972 RepID=A0A229RSU2_AMYAL|nr:AMP-binding protein [Amycolatopsis alba]OXM49728.1 AMP-dependent synthetase [Amycolatopsis alba DSM 44262]